MTTISEDQVEVIHIAVLALTSVFETIGYGLQNGAETIRLDSLYETLAAVMAVNGYTVQAYLELLQKCAVK
jgi:hypothetical protein